MGGLIRAQIWGKERVCQVLTSVRVKSSGPTFGWGREAAASEGNCFDPGFPFSTFGSDHCCPGGWGSLISLLTPLHHGLNNCPLNILI